MTVRRTQKRCVRVIIIYQILHKKNKIHWKYIYIRIFRYGKKDKVTTQKKMPFLSTAPCLFIKPQLFTPKKETELFETDEWKPW